MKVLITDGGRAAAGFKGAASDCVTRSFAIVSGRPYLEIYNALNLVCTQAREGVRKGSAREGVFTSREPFKRLIRSWGFTWVPCMDIATGCRVHLQEEELPRGRLVVRVSKHCTAVIDGVIHDTHDPQRGGTRCVYGYWILGE
jgi:hypothetical protein